MKCYLFAAILLLLTISGVSGLNLNFQNPSDFTSYMACMNSNGCSWVESATGGNNYLTAPTFAGVKNLDPQQFTYAAFDGAQSNWACITLYGTSSTLYQTCVIPEISGDYNNPSRIEVYMLGGTAYIYVNGIFNQNSTPLTTNPSYISWSNGYSPGGIYFDNFVLGSTESKYVFGQPESDAFIIKKDMINPASYGLAYTNGTVVNSYNMTSTWARSNYSEQGDPQTVVLRHGMGIASSSVVASTSTGNASTGSIAWDLNSAFFNNPNAPYGYYYTTIHNTDQYSNYILYLASGATVSFDRETYIHDQTAVITYAVTDGYWSSTYSYKVAIMSAAGNFVSNQSITTQTGSKTYTFGSTDPMGVYYAIVIATDSTGKEYWMNYDFAELVEYVSLTGYVMDQTGTILAGANVSVTQGTTTGYNISLTSGYNLSQEFETNAQLTVSTSKTGYIPDSIFFTPLNSGTIPINITLIATNHSYTGSSIGGVVRSSQYNSTIPAVTVYGINSTYGQTFTNVTNIAGYYLLDEQTDIILTSGRVYDIFGQKSGFTPARNYTVIAP